MQLYAEPHSEFTLTLNRVLNTLLGSDMRTICSVFIMNIRSVLGGVQILDAYGDFLQKINHGLYSR